MIIELRFNTEPMASDNNEELTLAVAGPTLSSDEQSSTGKEQLAKREPLYHDFLENDFSPNKFSPSRALQMTYRYGSEKRALDGSIKEKKLEMA